MRDVLSTVEVFVPEEILSSARDVATHYCTTLGQVLTKALVDAIRVEPNLARTAGPLTEAERERFRALLAQIPDVPPVAGDELPD